MVKLWPSMFGRCSAEILAWLRDPNSTKPARIIEPFLADGHHLQTGVEKFLRQEGVRFAYPYRNDRREPRATLKYPGFKVSGKVDGLIEADEGYDILEVKCVSDKKYRQLELSADWHQIYPEYEATALWYLSASEYELVGSVFVPTPAARVRFVFKNRNTSRMLGGVEGLDHPAYTYRPDMVLGPNDNKLNYTLKRVSEVVTLYLLGDDTEAGACDGDYQFCYHHKRPGRRHSIFIPYEPDLYSEVLARSADLIADPGSKSAVKAQRYFYALLWEHRAQALDFERPNGELLTVTQRDLL